VFVFFIKKRKGKKKRSWPRPTPRPRGAYAEGQSRSPDPGTPRPRGSQPPRYRREPPRQPRDFSPLPDTGESSHDSRETVAPPIPGESRLRQPRPRLGQDPGWAKTPAGPRPSQPKIGWGYPVQPGAGPQPW
jgi:hypothetical protein